MIVSVLSATASHLKDSKPGIKKYRLVRFLKFLAAVILFLNLSGCIKDTVFPKSKTELLTSTVWGDVDICGWISDPEIYTRIFEPGGRYLEYSNIYQSLYNGVWSLKDSENLIFSQGEYKILTLNENILEIKVRGGICISRFKALTKTKALTIGVTALSGTSARLHGFIRTSEATDVRFEYGTSTAYENAVIPDNNTFKVPASNIVNVTLAGLLPEKVYHYRIKASNLSGTTYGLDQTFRTFNSMTLTDADNNLYNTITIGSQIWTAENLKTTKYSDGSAIPLVRDNVAWTELNSPGYCWYNNDSLANKNIYGALYNWHTVNTGKLCPAGWHVPNDKEWTTLIQYLGQEAGSKLTEGAYDLPDPYLYADPLSRLEASNESGFSAKWTGTRGYADGADFNTSFCELWSSTEHDMPSASSVTISNGHALLYSVDKKYGLPVRCLKD